MKKLVTSLSLFLLAVATVVGVTLAYFNDATDMTGLTFSTGNADLQMTQVYMGHWFDGSATAADLWITLPTNLYPGYEGGWGSPDGAMYLGNFSDSPIDLVVSAKVDNYSSANADLANTVQMAMAWGGNCDNAGVGTGFHTLAWWQSHSATLFGYVSGSADPATCGFLPNDHSAGYQGYAKAIKIYLKVPTSAGNEIANADANFDVHFDAVQAH